MAHGLNTHTNDKTMDTCEQWTVDKPMIRHGRITWQTGNHMTDM